MIPFGSLAPDQPVTEPGYCTQAVNVLPKSRGYGPMLGPTIPNGAEALPAQPRGTISLVLNDGTWVFFAATEDTLYQLGGDYTWTQIATGYALPAGDTWSMVHFGSKLLFTNTVDGLLAYDVEAGGAVSSIASAGDPKFIFVANNQVWGLDCLNEASARDNRLIRVSAFNDHTNWDDEGADYQPLEGGGNLVAGGALNAGTAVVFQERAIRLLRFGQFGDNVFFRIEDVSDELGAVSAGSCVFHDSAVYWMATDGFRRMTLNGGIEPIGGGFVDDWLLDRVDQGKFYLMEGAADPYRKMIWWRWKRDSASDEAVFPDLIGFSWQWQRWVTAEVDTSALFRLATPGIAVDDYDVAVDDADLPVDDRFWQGGQPVFAILDDTYKVAFMSGSTLAATIETSVANNPITGVLQWCVPVTDASSATVSLGTSDALASVMSWATGVAIGESGRVPLDGRGMNIAFRVAIPAAASWSYATGIDHIVGSRGGAL